MSDLKCGTFMIIGFAAYSIPLLMYDLNVISRSPAPTDHAPAPPQTPPYHHYDDDDDGFKFRHAIGEGDMDVMQKLYDENMAKTPPVNLATKAHWHGATALFEAARSGQLGAAKWLVARGADADGVNDWGDSAVGEAASMGHWDMVWYLAGEGANLTRSNDQQHSSLALSAVRHKNHMALVGLQKHGVDLTTTHWNHNTILHEAARMGEDDLISWMLANTELDVNATNDVGETPLAEASTMGHTRTVWKLIEAGASLGEPDSKQALSVFKSAVSTRTDRSPTAGHAAATACRLLWHAASLRLARGGRRPSSRPRALQTLARHHAWPSSRAHADPTQPRQAARPDAR